MSQTTEFKVEIQPANAQKLFSWIKTRGGVARWRSINLSNPGAAWSTPAEYKDGRPSEKPNWQCGNTPEIITDPEQIGVCTEDVLFKAFTVTLRCTGMSLKLTDASQRKLDKALDACKAKHGNSFFIRGVLDNERPSMGVYYTKEIISLKAYIEKHGEIPPTEEEP